MLDVSIEQRKDDHVRIAFVRDVEHGSTLLNEVYLVHNALPELNIDDVNTEVQVFNKRLSMPLIIGALTGGTKIGYKINLNLAKIAEEAGIGISVGSQRIAIERPETRYTFTVVKEHAQNALKIANIGASQIAELDEKRLADACMEIVDMIDADAMSIHLNPLQELIQSEDRLRLSELIGKISYVVKTLNRPVIVKEVGFGLSKEVALKLKMAGVSGVDIAGSGGTSFVLIEGARVDKMMSRTARSFVSWGIPTVLSLCEVREVFDGVIIASGGVRSGIDMAKLIAIGADLTSISRPFLVHALRGLDSLREYVSVLRRELVMSMYLTNSRTVRDLRRAPVVFGQTIVNWIRQRDLRKCIERIGLRSSCCL